MSAAEPGEPASSLQPQTDVKSAAAALADLFFLPGPTLSDEDKVRANQVRRRYRDWRMPGGSASGAVPDVLDLNHEAATSERRSTAKMKRVKTVGARMHSHLSPVRLQPPKHPHTSLPCGACARGEILAVLSLSCRCPRRWRRRLPAGWRRPGLPAACL